MKHDDIKINVWYLVITMYGWNQTEGLPVHTIRVNTRVARTSNEHAA